MSHQTVVCMMQSKQTDSRRNAGQGCTCREWLPTDQGMSMHAHMRVPGLARNRMVL